MIPSLREIINIMPISILHSRCRVCAVITAGRCCAGAKIISQHREQIEKKKESSLRAGELYLAARGDVPHGIIDLHQILMSKASITIFR